MTPSGRAPADVIAGLEPKSAATVYGWRIPSTSELPAAVVSPIQPQNSGALVGVAVSVVVRFSGIRTPAAISTPVVSAWTVPPPPRRRRGCLEQEIAHHARRERAPSQAARNGVVDSAPIRPGHEMPARPAICSHR